MTASAETVLDAFLGLIAERGFANVTLRDVASTADLSMADLYRLYPDKVALAAAFMARIDATVLAGTPRLGKGLGLVAALAGAIQIVGVASGGRDPLQPLSHLGSIAGSPAGAPSWASYAVTSRPAPACCSSPARPASASPPCCGPRPRRSTAWS